ncbi:protein Wnt [Striga asiatica]|uniref:Protein Wnt n=1 Tax=Striga asiatica TaxID=4170 RepID=A0A5A7PEQ1_STRAF|nr:protein Wnt [Striga asiatica]
MSTVANFRTLSDLSKSNSAAEGDAALGEGGGELAAPAVGLVPRVGDGAMDDGFTGRVDEGDSLQEPGRRQRRVVSLALQPQSARFLVVCRPVGSSHRLPGSGDGVWVFGSPLSSQLSSPFLRWWSGEDHSSVLRLVVIAEVGPWWAEDCGRFGGVDGASVVRRRWCRTAGAPLCLQPSSPFLRCWVWGGPLF